MYKIYCHSEIVHFGYYEEKIETHEVFISFKATLTEKQLSCFSHTPDNLLLKI
jgi:hypothetical protein